MKQNVPSLKDFPQTIQDQLARIIRRAVQRRAERLSSGLQPEKVNEGA
ncbi:hypothetical protein [Alicyclobacillus fodiniaquatilis]|jgi:hypothetical protein|uniref:Uncharacterized protein n=1 Tax=Alicyclobacillus fodiniaquatilis TaxID=1661150 RepID=A0ABW4JR87_9BACL